MESKSIIIVPEIFDVFPTFRRGVVIVNFMKNEHHNSMIDSLLRKAVDERRSNNWIEHEYVKAWDEAHRKFNSNPNRYPPSVKALLKRIQKGGGVPFINSAVALFNYISLKYLLPCGGDDVARISGNLCLGFASGKEKFVPLGGNEEENPIPGEVIYFDDKSLKVMCRKWNWRNGEFSKITEDTKRAVINIDGIGPVPDEIILEARDELAELFRRYCEAEVSVALLTKENNILSINM